VTPPLPSSSGTAPWEPIPAASPPDPRVAAALEALWAECDRRLADLGVQCRACGQCCDFPRRGHVLFAMKAELDVCLDWARRHLATDPRDVRRRLDAGLCPFQDGPRCRIHPVRPLGCRIFFCKTGDAAQLERLAADLHDRLRSIVRDNELLQWYGPALAYIKAIWPPPTHPI